ncbi:unnamed protein product, partial [Ectocarpus sp. 8 AP-2014]
RSVVLKYERRVNVFLFLAWFLSHFTGPIPPELGNLEALQYLNLGDNELSGHIPPELGALSELQYL